MTGQTLGIGVIGLGFMGSTHVRAYQAASALGLGCRLVAVADQSAGRLTGRAGVHGNIGGGAAERLFDAHSVATRQDPHALLADPAVHAVSICTHTDTHVELAIAALRAGKHVLVEKPVATASAAVARLAAAVAASDRVCTPGMVMRFWPEWTWLRDAIRSGTNGAVRSATFQRMGSAPEWTDFYRDTMRSGGALFDLHVHDTDFIRWCFGEPESVTTVGTPDHLTTLYHFGSPAAGFAAAPAHVTAEAAQNITPGFGFRMRYTVVFERATADFDLSRTPALHLIQDGHRVPMPTVLPEVSAYDREIRAFLAACLAHPLPAPHLPTIEDALLTTKLLEAERVQLVSPRPRGA